MTWPSAARRSRDGVFPLAAATAEGGKIGPDLGTADRRVGLINFAAATWNKSPAMTDVVKRARITAAELRGEEMADILAYLYSVQYSAESGDATRGAQLVRAKGCLDCHAVSGGARRAVNLAHARGLATQAGVISALWNHVLIAEQAAAGSRAWPTMTDSEMADLAAYLQGFGGNR